MSISDNYSPDKSLGDGSTTEFSGSWSPLVNTYFKLALENVTTGVQTIQAQGSDYTLVFDDDGYVATMAVAPTSANRVVRYREIDLTQTVPYRTSKGFQGQVTEDSFDKLTAIDQDQQDALDRALKFAVGASITNPLLPTPVDGYGVVWDGTTGKMRNTTSSLAVLEGNAAIVAANIANVNIVATNITNVNLVAAINGDVTIVAGISSDVEAVAAISANVTTVAGIDTEITTLAGLDTEILALYAIRVAISAVAANETDISAVAAIDAAVSTVAGIDTEVVAVAANAANINIVAANDADISTVATNIADVQNAEENANIAKAAAGFTYTYSTTTTDADPGAGKFRLNNATLASATEMYISETTGLSQAIATEIATWDDSTSTIHGKLRIFKQADPSVFAIYNVTGTNTDAGSYDKITIAHVNGNGAWSNNDVMTIQYVRTGDKGDTGAAGSLPFAAGAGTVDAITANFSPDISLSDGQICIVTSTGANTVTNPTFAPDGLTAHTIVKNGNQALVAGDTGSAGYPMFLEYNLAGTRWELMNPAKIGEGDIVLADNATNNSSATKHGFLKKLSNVVTEFMNGQGNWSVPAGGFNSVVIHHFTANGTYTPTSGMKYCIVEGVGGGGGGGGALGAAARTSTGGGGGAGAYARKVLAAASIGASKAVTIGTGGNGGTAAPTSGNTGGTTDLGTSLFVAEGGSGGGNSSSTTPGAGGSGGGLGGGNIGDASLCGDNGAAGVSASIITISATGGKGGVSVGGRGGQGGATAPASGADGNNGVFGGGGGGASSGSTTGKAGGTGGNGYLTIIEFI